MGLFKNKKLIPLTGASFVIVILITLAFIIVVSDDVYCISPSPIISANPVNGVAVGTNITVSGQNFTPNGIAVLYCTMEKYTAKVDNNGNTSWSITQMMIAPYPIYALDENSTSRKSNTITIYPILNDAAYTPTPISNATSSLVSMANVTSRGPYAYITNSGSNTVSVIDTQTNTVTATVPVGNSPDGVAVIPDGTKIYVTNSGSNTVSVIDAATNVVKDTVTVGANPIGVAVSPDGTKIYVVNSNSSTVSIIDATINVVTATVPVGIGPMGVAVSPDGSRIYVLSAGLCSSTVSVIDATTNNVIANVTVGGFSSGIAVSRDGTKVYVTAADYGGESVSVIDATTNNVTAIAGVESGFGVNVTAIVDVEGYVNGIAVNPAGTRIYVPNAWLDNSNDSSDVSVIDAATRNVTANVTIRGSSSGIAVNPDGTKVYVLESDGNVSVIDAATNNVIANMTVGNMPMHIAFGQFSGRATPISMPTFSSSATPAPSPFVAVEGIGAIILGAMFYMLTGKGRK